MDCNNYFQTFFEEVVIPGGQTGLFREPDGLSPCSRERLYNQCEYFEIVKYVGVILFACIRIRVEQFMFRSVIADQIHHIGKPAEFILAFIVHHAVVSRLTDQYRDINAMRIVQG